MTGMLWFCKRSLAEEIKAACEYYLKKYGFQPTFVLVQYDEEIPQIDGLAIRARKYILKKHILVGHENDFLR